MDRKGFSEVSMIIIIGLILIVGVVGYLVWKNASIQQLRQSPKITNLTVGVSQATSTSVAIGSNTSATTTQGCTMLPYTGTIPLSQAEPYYTHGDPDWRGGVVCKFIINPNLPPFTFHFVADSDNTLGQIQITEGTSTTVIQTIPEDENGEYGISYDAIAPDDYQSILAPVDANFDGYKDLPILTECGATGNCQYDFYLYNSSTNQFVKNDFLSGLGTFSVDSAKQQVTTFSNGGVADWEQDTYQYQDGRYTLIQKIVSTSSQNGSSATINTYQLENGIMKLINSSSSVLDGGSPSTSTVSFDLPFKGFDLQLYAPDQTSSVIPAGDGYCGGEDGATQYQGTYEIIARKNKQTISTLPLGQMEFDSGTPHDGLNTVTYTPTGDQFIAINEYGSCAGDDSSFYTINTSNQLINIPFIGNGTSTIWESGGFSGPHASTDGTFCGYANAVEYYFCDAYQYRNYAFIQTDSWVTQDPSLPAGEVTDVDRAKRYLFDFGDSAAIKPYVPSDTQYVDEIDEIQTSTLPYKFQVDFANFSINDYQYIFEVNKTSEGFQAILPPTKI